MIVLGILFVIPLACQGANGNDGHEGPVGPPGRPGVTGAQGNDGTDGSIGGPGPVGPTGSTGEAGATGPQGPAGPAPAASELQAMVDTATVNYFATDDPDADQIALGARLYDNWMTTSGIDALDGDHPLWSSQSTNTRTEATTFRCKECHGWDYKGAAGAYGSGSHFTGFTGVIRAGKSLTEEDLFEVLRGGFNKDHDFRFDISRTNMNALAAFLNVGLKNYSELINYETKLPQQTPSLANGATRYDRTCSSCHGETGQKINFGSIGSPVYLGDVATGNPWEFLHKALYGQPGESGMPPVSTRGWDDQDLTDLLAHVQSLAN
jgi:mono/diheme cytochrome c family protein